jgi:accessory gene regulator B
MPALGILKSANCVVCSISSYEKSAIDLAAKKFSVCLNQRIGGDDLSQLKLEYGSKRILSDYTKAFVLMLLSLLSGTLLEAVVVLLTFRSINAITGGAHANTSLKCLGFSMFFFSLMPIILQNAAVSSLHSVMVMLGLIVAILKYVPVQKKVVIKPICPKTIKAVKLKAIFRTIAISVLIVICPIKVVATMALYGLTVALIALLPLTKTMMNGELKL